VSQEAKKLGMKRALLRRMGRKAFAANSKSQTLKAKKIHEIIATSLPGPTASERAGAENWIFRLRA
jgi:hypothetical protein